MTRKIDLAVLEALLRQGARRAELADLFDCSDRAVDKAITVHFPELRTRVKKIDNDLALEMYARGVKRADIARHFGVGWSAVQNVLNRIERASA